MFSPTLEEYLVKLDAVSTTEELTQLIEAFLHQFDISMFSAILVKNAALTSEEDIAWINNAPEAHFEEYQATNRINDDYGVRKHASENIITPYLIGKEFVSETPDILPNEVDFYDLNDSVGFKSGLVIPLKTPVDDLPTGFSIWSDLSREKFQTLLASHSGEIILFLMLAQRKVESALFVKANNLQALTDRERDCLGLIANGLRPEVIGDELGIATVTLNYHIGTARKKLSAATNAEAVAKAISYGLL
ncbi:MAG: hypothetical protein CMK07_10565 [Ponticaulis sp.]|nr:hypothetical protein [Ponticaulis sp.]